jgi:Helix-turn-helix domain
MLPMQPPVLLQMIPVSTVRTNCFSVSRRLCGEQSGLVIPQPKVSALLNGQLDGFSTERLFRFLNALGCDVKISISPPKPRAVGHVQVTPS